MRFWALYLPQFYETPENNKWWGEGYTEWTSVKKARPLYAGHRQPLEPYHDFYYDLSKKETLKWQVSLANKYGIEGFIHFHYWYEGRHLLEKPTEMLLHSPELSIGYCLCWANHSWTRAWDGKNHQILVRQTYGGVDEWEAHLQYLLPFFKDPRYFRMDGRPVFFLYKAGDITDGDKRISYWNRRLREEGVADGLYIVEYINTFNTHPSLSLSSGVYEDEPGYAGRFLFSPVGKARRVLCKALHLTDYQDYDHLWHLILKKKRTYGGREIFSGAFPMWDNSPRRGKDSRVIRGASPEKFKKYLLSLSALSRKDSSGITVINAWNEWGEGAILEPTRQYGYGYLKAVRNAVRHGNKSKE